MASVVEFSGPWFDGRAAVAITDYCRWSENEVVKQGAQMIRRSLHEVLRHPTGRYESTVVGRAGTIDGDGTVYGAWLEGVGSRNAPVTVFPGYHTFERVTPDIEKESQYWITPIPPRFMEEMN